MSRPAVLLACLLPGLLLSACQTEPDARQGQAEDVFDGPLGDALEGTTYCDPAMTVFPVGDAHNIGYDHSSCGTGTCEISCPDLNANSDWGGDHHGIDVFAYQGAPLLAVADGQIMAVGTPSSTSGLRVRLQDWCGWQYYYGHMDEAFVEVGDWVSAGDQIGTMGYTGTSSTHLHFNVSPWGDYSNDIDPFTLLWETSGTVCDGGIDTGDEGGGSSSDTSTDEGGGSSSDTSTDDGTCGAFDATLYLSPYDAVSSCDRRFSLVMQGDGNLVLYKDGGSALWHTSTHGNSGAWAAFQGDGNLVVYSAGGSALWASGTFGHSGAWLAVQDDGNLVIYSNGGSALWYTGTNWY